VRFQQIYDWIEAQKPEVILEVGTWNGLNAARMMKYGAKKYIGFDLWEDGNETIDELENNVKKRASLEEAQKNLKGCDVELIKGNTRETLKAYADGKKPFVDMAVIDGGHSKGTIKSDMLMVMKIMKPGGFIFLDDYYYNCPTPNVGAQTVMEGLNVPYTVMPKSDRVKDGSVVKIVRIDMRDVPRLDSWNMEKEASWQFKPGEAA
jgi:predicted O-methyltransferase YrrM